MPSPSRRIETANSLSLDSLRSTHFSSALTSSTSTPLPLPLSHTIPLSLILPQSQTTKPHIPTSPARPSSTTSALALALTLTLTLTLTLERSSSMSRVDLQQCLDLIADTSAGAYRASGLGWAPGKKRREMRLMDLRYLVVKSAPGEGDGDGDGEVQGFCSFMLTYEDGCEVVYCYELHLRPRVRGLGIGKLLMGLMEGVGREVGVEKAMLTCFVENQEARRFYERLGYDVDEYSPSVRRLRGGVLKKPTYVILSKRLGSQGELG